MKFEFEFVDCVPIRSSLIDKRSPIRVAFWAATFRSNKSYDVVIRRYSGRKHYLRIQYRYRIISSLEE